MALDGRARGERGIGLTVLDHLVMFSNALSVGRLPPEVVEEAKLCVLDTLSSCLTIDAAPQAQAALRTIAVGP